MPMTAVVVAQVLLSISDCTSTHEMCKRQGDDCSDMFSGNACKDLLNGGYTCPELRNMGGCADCTCKDGEYDAKETKAPPRQGSCAGQTSSVCYASLDEWQKEALLKQHNTFRSAHGACPLTYDTTLEDYAKNSDGFKATCTTQKLTHNKGGPYGENLAYVLRQHELQDYNPADATHSWYCTEENCWDYSLGTNTRNGGGVTGHMTQVVWNATTTVGCALCHVGKTGDSNYNLIYLMCSYSPGGNSGAYLANVKPHGTTPPSACVNTASASVWHAAWVAVAVVVVLL